MLSNYSVPICVFIVYQMMMIPHSSPIGKIRRTMSSTLALTQLVDGGVLPYLVLNEALFVRRPIKLKIAWGVCLWVTLIGTYTRCSVVALPYLALNAYYLVNQFRMEAAALAVIEIDPIFYHLIRAFSEIIKFGSLAKHFELVSSTKDVLPFLGCTAMNIISSGLDASTSISLLTHAIVANVPFVVIVKWGFIMLLAHWYKPFYEFNVVAVYMVDALFFIRVWYI